MVIRVLTRISQFWNSGFKIMTVFFLINIHVSRNTHEFIGRLLPLEIEKSHVLHL